MEYRKKTCENASLVKKTIHYCTVDNILWLKIDLPRVFFIQFDAIFVSFYLEFV